MSYTFDFSFLSEYWPAILLGAWQTLRMTLMSCVPGVLLGIAVASLRRSGPVPLRWALRFYVDAVRNTPLIIQAFWLFFGLASLHVHLSALTAAVVTLVLNVGAYVAEIVRAGLDAVGAGQREAASSLALSRLQVFRLVELPQALKKVYPSLSGQLVLMMLATSVMSQISADELTGDAYQIQALTYRGFEAYLVVAVVYLALTALLRGVLAIGGRLAFPSRPALGSA